MPRASFAPALTASVLLASFAMLAWNCHAWWPLYADDSYITLRYAKNWVDGYGPVFNPGESPVEGYSNPLWMALMAGGMQLGLDPVATSKWLGVASAAALVAALFAALAALGVPGPAAALATWPLSSCELVAAWGVAGLETLAYALLLFAGLALLVPPHARRGTSAAASALLCMAALIRPEGVAFWLGGLGFLLLFRRAGLLAYAPFSLVLLLHLLWRHHFYGDWLPNTWYVRSTTSDVFWVTGLPGLRAFLVGFHPIYFTGFFPAHGLWLLAAVAGAVVATRFARQGLRALLMGVVVIFYLAWIASIGDDNQGFFRYHVALLAPLAYLAGLGFLRGPVEPGALAPFRAGLALLLLGISVHSLITVAQTPENLRVRTRFQEGNEKLGRQLAATRPADTLIAVGAAGAIPYYSGLPTIDMLGLSDRKIARGEPNARTGGSFVGHQKFDARYVLSRRPDIVVLNQGYWWEGHPLGDAPEKSPLVFTSSDPMNAELYDEFYWNPEYALRALDLGGGTRYYVFERVSPDAREPAS